MRVAVVVLAVALAGCLHPSEKSDTVRAEADPEFPGLVVEGRLSAVNGLHHVSAVADNAGSTTFQVAAACIWKENRWSSGRLVADLPDPDCHREESLQDFRPGQRLTDETEWNGTVQDAQTGEYAPATAGTYTWVVHFFVATKPSGSGAGQTFSSFPLSFNVTVA